ncbi:SpoIIE family protein phosphatase [Kitasatospora aburaviensis]
MRTARPAAAARSAARCPGGRGVRGVHGAAGIGEVLLLYTDGLVERRDLSVEESVDQLLRAAGAPGADLERYLDLLLEVSPSDTDDDTCLIAVRVE